MKLEIRDAAKKVFIDGVERISSTDNAITAAGKAAIRYYNSDWGFGTTGKAIDNFVATNTNGSPGPSQTITFGANETTKQITVLVNGDTTYETDEAFTVHLSNASERDDQRCGWHGDDLNDDAAPSFAIDDVTHSEGDAGTTSYVFTVTKTGSTALSASVDYPDSGWNSGGAETTIRRNSGTTLNFAANRDDQDRSRSWSTATRPMRRTKHSRSTLSNASGATISDADGTGTITNDDAAPSFAIDDVIAQRRRCRDDLVRLHGDQDWQHGTECIGGLTRQWMEQRVAPDDYTAIAARR